MMRGSCKGASLVRSVTGNFFGLLYIPDLGDLRPQEEGNDSSFSRINRNK